MNINQEEILRRAAQHLNDITGYASDERIDNVRTAYRMIGIWTDRNATDGHGNRTWFAEFM